MPKEEKGGWKKGVWDSDTGEFLGRTGGSWFKILVFYVIFYAFLAGIFIGTIQCLLMTLNNYKPTWQDRVAPPGLSHHPRALKSEVAFASDDVESYLPYTKGLKEFLAQYDDDKQTDNMKFEDCGDEPDVAKFRGELDGDPGVKKACRFSRSLLGPCSGIDDKDYGFSQGKPCIIVKLNRIVNFRPKPPATNTSIPEEAHYKVQPNVIPIYCTNKREEDAGKVGEVLYHGIGGGFPLQYYPYYGKTLHPYYLQPLVAVQFINVTMNMELRIECKVYGENIGYSDKDRYQGRFDLKLTVRNS